VLEIAVHHRHDRASSGLLEADGDGTTQAPDAVGRGPMEKPDRVAGTLGLEDPIWRQVVGVVDEEHLPRMVQRFEGGSYT
jgi:hypothetical protein